MFWGLIMEPERRYTQKVKKSFHVSMASLDLATSTEEPCQVMCGYEGRNYLLCTLRQPDLLQCPLDLEFATGSEVSFASNGGSHIHLTGYLTDVDDDLNLADLAEEEEEEEVIEEEQVEVLKEKKKNKNKTKEKTEPPSKKAKLVNGSAKEVAEEEEESDDPDYQEAEEESDGLDEENEEEVDSDDLQGEEEEDEEAEDEEEIKAPPSKKEKKNAKQKPEPEAKKSKKAELKKQRTLNDGVIIEDLTEGNGPPAKLGRFVNVYYEGKLQKTNRVFDSTTKGPGFKFRLGAGEVIKAWDIGLVGMKTGGVRKIICPPHTAYGAKGSPPAIPPHSTLVFTVTLKKVN